MSDEARDPWRLQGRVALIAGAGRGLGRGCALELAAAGAKVVLASRTLAEVQAVAGEVAALGAEAVALEADALHLPLRTASRARARVEGFTSRVLSAVRRLTISREMALASWSTARTGMRLASVEPLPPKTKPKNEAMAMGAAMLIMRLRRSWK